MSQHDDSVDFPQLLLEANRRCSDAWRDLAYYKAKCADHEKHIKHLGRLLLAKAK